jgi:hypothetical protein
MADEFALLKEQAGRWVKAFRQAGGKEVYVVLGLADLPGPPFLVVPIPPGADGKALAATLRLSGLEEPQVRDNVVLVGSKASLARLGAAKGAPRPDLASALAGAGDAPVRAALALPADLRRAIEEIVPRLPPELGGAPSRTFTRGVRWVSVSFSPVRHPRFRLVIETADDRTATALGQVATAAGKLVAADRDVQVFLPEIGKIIAQLTPRREEKQLVVELQERDYQGVVGAMVGAAVRAAEQQKIQNDLRMIAVGLINASDTARGLLPAPASFGPDGKPLVSWRVHLLPYLDEAKLYKEFRLDEPWDSEHNRKLIARMPRVFQGQDRKLNAEGKTVYLLPVGEGAAFPDIKQRRKFPADFSDGTSNTIFVVQADPSQAVIWTKPQDLAYDARQPRKGLSTRYAGGFLAVLADGSARLIRGTVSDATLRALFTPAGGEVLGADW